MGNTRPSQCRPSPSRLRAFA
ncbi:MAG: hypothetical protein IBJ05_08240 [Blastomonas sp.]|nr:hypothetical protein [Blastomonas sp.]